MKHLAIFSKETLGRIIKGEQTTDVRFSKSKIAPFGAVSVGDLVYMKPPGEEIKGQFLVKKVIFFDGLDREDRQFIKTLCGKLLAGAEDQGIKYATLIFIGQVEQFITSPVKIDRKLKGWMVLG